MPDRGQEDRTPGQTGINLRLGQVLMFETQRIKLEGRRAMRMRGGDRNGCDVARVERGRGGDHRRRGDVGARGLVERGQ